VIAATLALTQIGAGSIVTIPRSPNSPYGDEEVIRRSIPELGSATRIEVCDLKGSPSWVELTFEPEVVGDHQVRTRLVDCLRSADQADHLDCRFSSKTEIFDENPRDSFELDADVSTDEALRLVRAFERQRGELSASSWAGFRTPGFWIGRIGRNGSNYSLRLRGCACSGRVELRADTSGPAMKLALVGEPNAVCF
jgi:hypothetical protein